MMGGVIAYYAEVSSANTQIEKQINKNTDLPDQNYINSVHLSKLLILVEHKAILKFFLL